MVEDGFKKVAFDAWPCGPLFGHLSLHGLGRES